MRGGVSIYDIVTSRLSGCPGIPHMRGGVSVSDI